ncbi:MAG: sulfur oxidation c-type cytochrome SoxX [Pseudolabrys sp.]
MTLRQTGLALGLMLAAATLAAHPAAAQAPDALKLINSQCQQCHEIKGISDFGNVGPSLIGLKSRYADRKDVVAIVTDETKRNELTVMPPFGRNHILTDQEIQTIVDYLYNQ